MGQGPKKSKIASIIIHVHKVIFQFHFHFGIFLFLVPRFSIEGGGVLDVATSLFISELLKRENIDGFTIIIALTAFPLLSFSPFVASLPVSALWAFTSFHD